MRWPKYWSFSFSIIPSKEHPGLISFRVDWLDLLAVQATLKSLLHLLSVVMAAAVAGMLRGGLLPQAGRLPTHQIIRYGSKAVTRHRRVMHFERQKLMAVTEYIAPKPVVNPRCLPPPPSPPKEVRRRLGMSPVVGWWIKVILSLWP